MVSTRSASAALMTPRTGRSSSPPAPPSTSTATSLSKSPTKTRAANRNGTSASTSSTAVSSSTGGGWTHTPTTLTLTWLTISIPLVLWDLLYVFLRPHSMPGGKLHWPIWVPYAIQAELDYTYGTKAWVAGDGWNAAQSAVNAVESAAYLWYLAIWWREAGKDGRREVKGTMAGWLATVGFATATVTVGKTVLYWLNEAFSGFANIGHNPPAKLFFLWIIPNGAWIVFPTIMVYQFGKEILNGLALAASVNASGRAVKNE